MVSILNFAAPTREGPIMATSDRIDPGPGWRLLKPGEVKPRGYEYKSPNLGWTEGEGVGNHVLVNGFPCRVRDTQRTIKGIATRATVRSVFAGGITTESTIRSDVGLSLSQMERATEAYEKQVSDLRNKFAMPEYIMFEIQRGPNDC